MKQNSEFRIQRLERIRAFVRSAWDNVVVRSVVYVLLLALFSLWGVAVLSGGGLW
jgi:hypothetical protein